MEMPKVPLLIYPAKVYLGWQAFSGASTRAITTVPLASGTSMPFTIDTVVLSMGLILLAVELVRQMSPRTDSYVNHAMSAVLAIGATIGFVTFTAMGTTTWAALTLMMWVDVVVGLLVSARLSSGQNVWIENK